MADENEGGGDPLEDCPKCPPCPPGLPGWMATFSDLVTLLLTFFVLLLSFAKTETAKYEAALGSVRNAFGGNVLKHGEVVQRGKSADNSPTMVESQQIVKPFPIDFLTTEGFLDKHEINKSSTETLKAMKSDLAKFGLTDNITIYETAEGLKVRVKDKVLFKKGSTQISNIKVSVLENIIKLLTKTSWIVFIEGYSNVGETGPGGSDALTLSSMRSIAVSKFLMSKGVSSDKISSVFYGDSRPDESTDKGRRNPELNRKVEFLIRKVDLRSAGRKVDPI